MNPTAIGSLFIAGISKKALHCLLIHCKYCTLILNNHLTSALLIIYKHIVINNYLNTYSQNKTHL